MLVAGLIAVIAVLIFCYERRWRMLKHLIEDLHNSVESDRELLLDEDRMLATKTGLSRLMAAIRVKMDERTRFLAQSASQMEQIETTFRNMREGALVIDVENNILVSNLSADRLLNGGVSLVGRRIERFIHHPSFLDFVREVKQERIYGRRQIEVDLMGKTAWLEISGAALESSGQTGREGLSLYLVNDITRLKKLEAIRRDFAANVSHELRTPITIIKGFAETLHNDGSRLSEEKKANFIEKIHRNAGRLHTLVEDLLSLSRLESRTLELNKTRCNLADEIRTFAAEFRLPSSSTASLRFSVPEERIEVEVDRTYLGRILANLVENAFKHGETLSYVEVALRVDDENGLVEMSVSDDGIGIPERARVRIFQRFYRLDKGRSVQTGGTGLGLSIVRHAMLANGGNVRVVPNYPQGTKFVCVFPRMDAVVVAGKGE